jgi:signal transduction histidine kinase
MRPRRLESRIRLLMICFTSLIIVAISGIGWLILLDAEDAVHDRYFEAAARKLSSGDKSSPLPAGITMHCDASFVVRKLNLRGIPATPGPHEVFANNDLSESILVRNFSDKLRLWIRPGYEREFRLWLAPPGPEGNRCAILADVSSLEVSEREAGTAGRRLVMLGSLFLLTGLVVSHLITRWAMNPVRKLTRDILESPTNAGPSLGLDAIPDDEFGELAGALEGYRKRLDEATQRERHFLSDCSHELRTPIATMKSALELLGQELEDPAAQGRVVARLKRSTQRMERLVQTFLLIARGRRPPAEELPVVVVDVVRQVAAEIRALRTDHPLEVRIDGDAGVIAEINREAFAVLCHNLLGNVYQHAGAGRVDLVIRSCPDRITLTCQDDGPGLAETKGASSSGGHGIGLPLVERLCATCGWRLIRGGGPGKGARFEVEMPVHRQPLVTNP